MTARRNRLAPAERVNWDLPGWGAILDAIEPSPEEGFDPTSERGGSQLIAWYLSSPHPACEVCCLPRPDVRRRVDLYASLFLGDEDPWSRKMCSRCAEDLWLET